ncbi:MAG: NAD(P)H-hydrate dehydratase [Patescibacteria group bacterium]
MQQFDPELLKDIYVPPAGSHKGQNGKLMIIGGSQLFHAASLWALQIASKIVDMVFYSSVAENNLLVESLKKEFRNGIIVRQEDIDAYIEEADAVLIGPGMVRTEHANGKWQMVNGKLEEILLVEDEGMQTYYLTKYLLATYPKKKWIIDAGALQMLEPEWLLPLNGNVILTPHHQEFGRVFSPVIPNSFRNLQTKDKKMLKQVQHDTIKQVAKKYNCTILLKGEKDIVCSPEQWVEISGGNAGMTKGGTGDVLAGLVAALACKNELYLAATAGSYFNKKAGEALFERVGYYFNASDLTEEIPQVMRTLLLPL